MNTVAGLLIVALIVLFYLRWRERRSELLEERGFNAGKLPRKPAGPYHAVSVKPCEDACQAVQALAGKPLLPDEVPRLPVEGCGRLNCECRYAHYDDRRGYRDDRRSVSTMSSTVYEDAGKRDRRNHQGRRETDL